MQGQDSGAGELYWNSHNAYEGLSLPQQSFVNTGYQHQAGGGTALPQYLYPGDYQLQAGGASALPQYLYPGDNRSQAGGGLAPFQYLYPGGYQHQAAGGTATLQYLYPGDYRSQAGQGLALPQYLYPGGYQQNQGQALVSFDTAVEPQASFTSDFDPHSCEAASGNPSHSHGYLSSSYRHQQQAKDGAGHDTSRAAVGSFSRAASTTAQASSATAQASSATVQTEVQLAAPAYYG